ncbi:corrinoid protein [bacterium]|nr:corrinoid protein [candidate division CSSED10-310 bacterium]
MTSEQIIEQTRQAVIDGDAESSRKLAGSWLEMGLDPLLLINRALTPGIEDVGRLWEEGEYFLPELVAGAEAVKTGMQILEKELSQMKNPLSETRRVIIGTIFGDIHDIGKSLVATLLRANGYRVQDLGSDVHASRFLEAFQKEPADLICISALLTTTMIGIPDVIRIFNEHSCRSQVKFLIGGAPVTGSWAETIGADGYGADAVDAVRTANRLIGKIQ